MEVSIEPYDGRDESVIIEKISGLCKGDSRITENSTDKKDALGSREPSHSTNEGSSMTLGGGNCYG